MVTTEERLARIENELTHMATKADVARLENELKFKATQEDIQKLKVWVLTGGGIAGGAGGVITWLARVWGTP